MVTFLEYTFDRSALLWYGEVDVMVITDLRQA